MKPEPSCYLNKPRFLLPIIAFALLSTTFPSRILANSLLIRKGGSSLASSAHFDLIFGNELLFGSPFAGGSSSGGGGGGVLRQKSIFNHKLPTQNLPSESIMIDHRPATIAVGEQNSNNTFLSEQMDFIDVLLMFFFISGVVINLLAFFVAFIIFWNNPIVKSYILNMIAADLMLLVTGFYLKFKRIFKLLSVSSCKIVFTTDAAILHVSCWTITIIAFYRYCKLFPIRFFSTPMSDCFSKRWFVNLSLLFLWVVPFIIASPMAYYSNFDTDLVKCDSEMPYDFQTFYNVLTFLTSYVVPGLLVTFLYSRIISKTRSAISMSANRATSSSEDSSSHVNMMRFLTYVVMAFWLLHFPFWCCNLSSTFQLYEFPRSFLHLSIIMTYFNAALNPFLYALLSVDCARLVLYSFHKLLSWWRTILKDRSSTVKRQWLDLYMVRGSNI